MTLIETTFSNPNVLATIALGISFLSIIIGVCSLWLQHKHNITSVRPIGIISLADYEDKLTIRIKNAGMGTLIVKSIETRNNNGNKKEYPIDWMPSGISWAGFRRDLQKHAIKEGDSVVLLEFKYDPQKHNDTIKDSIRSILENLTITITYEDIYGIEQPVESRSLDWFGRTLSKKK